MRPAIKRAIIRVGIGVDYVGFTWCLYHFWQAMAHEEWRWLPTNLVFMWVFARNAGDDSWRIER